MTARGYAPLLAALLLTGLLSGCSVLAVADAAVTVTATTVDIGAKAVGAAVDITSAGIKAATRSSSPDTPPATPPSAPPTTPPASTTSATPSANTETPTVSAN
ncbi:MAG TPA: hypothetical protein VJ642_06810 [Chromobacteriaceae bacterium]|nr:hypothetical protein [Chromobacteriaceae bacterium]